MAYPYTTLCSLAAKSFLIVVGGCFGVGMCLAVSAIGGRVGAVLFAVVPLGVLVLALALFCVSDCLELRKHHKQRRLAAAHQS